MLVSWMVGLYVILFMLLGWSVVRSITPFATPCAAGYFGRTQPRQDNIEDMVEIPSAKKSKGTSLVTLELDRNPYQPKPNDNRSCKG